MIRFFAVAILSLLFIFFMILWDLVTHDKREKRGKKHARTN